MNICYLYSPALQAAGVKVLSIQLDPSGHCVQLAEFVESAYSPSAQSIQVAPPSGLDLPSAHAMGVASTVGHLLPKIQIHF